MRFHLFLFSFLLLQGTLKSETSLPSPLSLSEILEIALKNNPSTKQAWWSSQRAAQLVGIAKSDTYPKIDLEAGAQHGRTFKYINGPNTNYSNVNGDIVASLLLFDFGETKANILSTKIGLAAANWSTDAAIQKVMVQVFQNYYNLLYAQELLEAEKIAFEESEKLLKASQALNSAGLVSISDVYTSQATLAQMKMRYFQQEAVLSIQKAKLATSLGLSPTENLNIASVSLPEKIEKKEIPHLIAMAMEKRQDLLAKHARVAQSIALQKKVKASYGPKLRLNARAGADEDFIPSTAGFHYKVACIFSMPLFNGFETTYKNRLAYTDTRLSMEELAELQLTIAMEVFEYARTFESLQEMLPQAQESLLFSQKAFEGVMEKYRAGVEKITTVSTALTQSTTARAQLSEIKTRYLTSLANLAYSIGTLSPYLEETSCENTL